jgi:hypothetical protein
MKSGYTEKQSVLENGAEKDTDGDNKTEPISIPTIVSISVSISITLLTLVKPNQY